MLKVKKISAVSLTLGDVEYTFVQQGAPWNTLVEYICVSGGEHAGQSIVAAPDPGHAGHGRMRGLFDRVFGRLDEEQVIVMATDGIGKALRELQAPKAAPSTEGSAA